jgi:hypothetical protein
VSSIDLVRASVLPRAATIPGFICAGLFGTVAGVGLSEVANGGKLTGAGAFFLGLSIASATACLVATVGNLAAPSSRRTVYGTSR